MSPPEGPLHRALPRGGATPNEASHGVRRTRLRPRAASAPRELLTTANTKLVSVIIYDLNESGDLGAISVLGITLLVISFLVVALANRLPRTRGSARP